MNETNETTSNGASHTPRKARTLKQEPATMLGIDHAPVDHIQARREHTEAMKAERQACLERAKLLTQELGDDAPISLVPAVGRVARAVRAVKAAKTTHGSAPVKAKTASAPRLARRSQEDIDLHLKDIVSLLSGSPDGLRAEQIRTNLKLDAKELPRILKHGLATKALKKRGEKRATSYSAR